jgi:GGDEF domain-containing protein
LLAQANAQLSDLAFDLYGDVSRLIEELQTAVRAVPCETPPVSPARQRGDETVVRASGNPAGASLGERVRYDDAGRTRQQSVMSSFAGSANDDPGLVGRIAAAIASGRQQHRPVSLVLIEIDRYSDWVFALGPERAAAAERLLQAAATQLSPQGGKCLAIGEARYALLWDCDRREAAQSGRLLGQALANWWDQRQEAAALTVSIGIATLAFPSKNFPPRELLTPAQRCLSAANLSGGNCVKSIEV